jgi:hypothetical protein
MYNFIEGMNPFSKGGDMDRIYKKIVKGDFEFSSD